MNGGVRHLLRAFACACAFAGCAVAGIALAQDPAGSATGAATPTPAADATATATAGSGKRLAEARRRLEEVQQRIAGAAEKEEALLSALDESDREIALMAADIATLKEQVADARARSEEHRQAMEDLRQRIERRKTWLAGRLRSLYVHGRPGYLRILFASESYGDLLRRTKYQSIVARHDAEMVGSLKKDLEEVARRRVDYEQDLALLEGMEGDSRLRAEELELERQLRASLLAEVRSERSDFEKMRDALQRAAAALTDKVASLGKAPAATPSLPMRPFMEAKGRLLPPVTDVPVVLPFGPYRHPRLGLPMIHQGVKYGAPVGVEVHAVYDGRIEMAKWFSSYGQVLIVDHGDGWRSLYAHCSRLLKKDGDVVKEGDVIAHSGDTGSIDGPMLYFAIYREGKPVDPAEWLVK